jgi:hypothetical protein
MVKFLGFHSVAIFSTDHTNITKILSYKRTVLINTSLAVDQNQCYRQSYFDFLSLKIIVLNIIIIINALPIVIFIRFCSDLILMLPLLKAFFNL